MRTLIVNADDLGLSRSVSQGVLQAHDRGIVTSASLLVNTPGFEFTVPRIRKRSRLSVGLHFNLTLAAPVSPPESVPTLVDDQGRFTRYSEYQTALWSAEDVRTELGAQMQRCERAGLTVTHLDTHEQIDRDDRVLGIVLDQARIANVPCRGDRRAEVVAAGVPTTTQVIRDPHFHLPDGQTHVFQHLTLLPEGVTELVCHPGRVDRTLRRLSPWADERAGELHTFTGPLLRRIVGLAGIRLASFRERDLLGDAERPPEPEVPNADTRSYDRGFDAGFNTGYDQGFDAGSDQARRVECGPRWDLYRTEPIELPELRNLKMVAVVPAVDEEKSLEVVLQQLRRLPLAQVVVVVNGSPPRTLALAAASGFRVVQYSEALGHDIGRALGAIAAEDADVWLFTDADMPIEAEDFVPFLQAAAGGVDMALNNITAFVPVDGPRHVVSVAKDFLNRVLGRPDLGINSLTAVPHALSRRALAAIGPARLAVPPLAHAVAILEGLNVQAVHGVDVIGPNQMHNPNSTRRSPGALERLILGDHVEALTEVLRRLGARAGIPDRIRHREVLPRR